jgi:hypothetical protein
MDIQSTTVYIKALGASPQRRSSRASSDATGLKLRTGILERNAGCSVHCSEQPRLHRLAFKQIGHFSFRFNLTKLPAEHRRGGGQLIEFRLHEARGGNAARDGKQYANAHETKQNGNDVEGHDPGAQVWHWVGTAALAEMLLQFLGKKALVNYPTQTQCYDAQDQHNLRRMPRVLPQAIQFAGPLITEIDRIADEQRHGT